MNILKFQINQPSAEQDLPKSIVNDFELPNLNRLSTITILSTSQYVVGLEIQYESLIDIPNTLIRGSHSKDIKSQRFILSENEEIISVFVKYDTFIEKIEFMTNIGNVYNFGGIGGKQEKLIQFPLGYILVGFNGFCNQYLESIEILADVNPKQIKNIYQEIQSSAEKFLSDGNEDDGFEAKFQRECQQNQHDSDDSFLKNIFDIQDDNFEDKKSYFSVDKLRQNFLNSDEISFDMLGLLKNFLKSIQREKQYSQDLKNETFIWALYELTKNINYPQLLILKDLKSFDIDAIQKTDFKSNIFDNIIRILCNIYSITDCLVNYTPEMGDFKKKRLLQVLMNLKKEYIDFFAKISFFNQRANQITQDRKEHESEKLLDLWRKTLNLNSTISGRYIGNYFIGKSFAKQLYDTSGLKTLRLQGLKFQKINPDQLIAYELQSFIYCLHKTLFNVEGIPSSVIKMKKFQFKEGEWKSHQYYYIVTFDLVDNEDYVLLENELKAENNIFGANNLEQLLKRNQYVFMANVFSLSLETMTPQFVIKKSENLLMRYAYYVDPSDISVISNNDSGLRNPLFYLSIFQGQLVPDQIQISIDVELIELKTIKLLCWLRISSYFKKFRFISKEQLKLYYEKFIQKMIKLKNHQNCNFETYIEKFNPMISLIVQNVKKLILNESSLIEKLQKINFKVFMKQLAIFQKLYPPFQYKFNVREYCEMRQRLILKNYEEGNDLYNLIIEWILSLNLDKMTCNRQATCLQFILTLFPLYQFQVIYNALLSKIDWKKLFYQNADKNLIINLMFDLNIDFLSFDFAQIKSEEIYQKQQYSSLHIFTDQEEKDLDLTLIEKFIDLGLEGDKGYPNLITPFEIALKRNNHKMILKLLKCGAGARVHLHYLQEYIQNLDNISSEEYKLSIQIILKLHPDIEWKVLWKILQDQGKLQNQREELIEIDVIGIGKFKSLKSQFEVLLSEGSQRKSINPFEEQKEFQIVVKNTYSDLKVHVQPLQKNHLFLYSVHNLFNYIIPQGYSSNINFVKIQNKYYKFTQNQQSDSNIFISNEYIKDLDLTSFAEYFFINLLFLCIEFTPKTLFIQKHPLLRGKYKLSCNLEFCVETLKNNQYFDFINLLPKAEYCSHIQPSLLFCLDQMKKPISQIFVKFIAELDLIQVYEEWLQQCDQISKEIYKKWENRWKIRFKSDFIRDLVIQLLKLKRIFQSNPFATPMEILSKVFPGFSQPYIQGFEKITIVNNNKEDSQTKRFEYVQEIFNQQQENYEKKNLLRKDLQYLILLEEKEFMEELQILNQKSYKWENFITAQEGLVIFSQIKPIFEKKLFEDELIEFNEVRKFSSLRSYINSLDFSNLSKNLQEKWLSGLQFKSKIYTQYPLYLRLQGFSFLTNAIQLRKLQFFTNLKILIINESGINDEIGPFLGAGCPLLESLDLSRNQGIVNFDQNIKMLEKLEMILKGQNQKILFPSLKNLIMEDCKNLKNLVLKADLQRLSVRNCVKLQYIDLEFISLEQQLKLINFQGIVNYPEKEVLKFLKTCELLFINNETSKGAFSLILQDFPNFPNLNSNHLGQKNENACTIKYINYLVPAMQRPENQKFLENVRFYDIGLDEAQMISQLIKNQVRIKQLNFSGSQNFNFHGLTKFRSMKNLIDSFSGLFNIQQLDISNCYLGKLGFKVFSDIIQAQADLFSLKDLNLQNTKLSDEKLHILSTSFLVLCKHSKNTLQKLILSKNQIGNVGLKYFGEYLSHQNCNLKSLDLSENKLDDLALKTIGQSLQGNKSLKNIDLSVQSVEEQHQQKKDQCQKSDYWLLSIAREKFTQKSIDLNKSLELNAKTQSTDLGILELINYLEKNDSLQHLALNNHRISKNTAELLKNFINQHQSISRIEISSNSIEKEFHILIDDNKIP